MSLPREMPAHAGAQRTEWHGLLSKAGMFAVREVVVLVVGVAQLRGQAIRRSHAEVLPSLHTSQMPKRCPEAPNVLWKDTGGCREFVRQRESFPHFRMALQDLKRPGTKGTTSVASEWISMSSKRAEELTSHRHAQA